MFAAAAAVRLGWASVFGPMVAIREGAAHYSFGSLLRTLMRPQQATVIQYPAAGIVAGTFTGCGSPELIQDILAERLGDLGVPLIAWANVVHGGRFQTFPVGIAAEMDAGTATLRLVDPPLTAGRP